MLEIGTVEHASKAEYRLKIRLGAHMSQFVDLRTPAPPGADYLFHVSNSHVKIDPKFVTDNLERVLAARFETDVEEGNERIAARETVIDLGGDLAHFRPGRLRTARDFRLLTHSEAIELAQYLGLPFPRERREYSLAEIYNPDEPSVREMLAAHIGFFAEN